MPKTAETSEFWRRLKSLPAFELLNQRQIGKIAGVGQTAANKWKIGTGLPTLENAIALARKGGVCVEWLLTERGPKSPEPDDPDTAALLRHWRVLVPEARTALLRTARLEHAMQFTGDPEARSAYQKRLQGQNQVHDRSKSKS